MQLRIVFNPYLHSTQVIGRTDEGRLERIGHIHYVGSGKFSNVARLQCRRLLRSRLPGGAVDPRYMHLQGIFSFVSFVDMA